MKRFNTLHSSLVSLLITFSAYGMDQSSLGNDWMNESRVFTQKETQDYALADSSQINQPKSAFLDLFNNANEALALCIITEHTKKTDPIKEFRLTKDIKFKILESYQTLSMQGFDQASLNKINDIKYTTDNIPFFEGLKTASLKAYIQDQPDQLYSLLKNTFAGLDCKNRIYTSVKNSPEIINKIAEKYKQDSLFLIQELMNKVQKRKNDPNAVSKVYLAEQSKNLTKITLFCNEQYQKVINTIKKNVLALCKNIINTPLPEEIANTQTNDLEAKKELLNQFKQATSDIIKYLEELAHPAMVADFDKTKDNLYQLFNNIYDQIKQLEPDILETSDRLLRIRQIQRSIKLITRDQEAFSSKKFINLIQKIKNITIKNTSQKNSDSPMGIESSSLQLKETATKSEVSQAKENRKSIVEKLKTEDEILKKLKSSAQLNINYIHVLQQHIATLEEYLSKITNLEPELTEKTLKKIQFNKEILDLAMNKVYVLLPYPSTDNSSVADAFNEINQAIIAQDKNAINQAVDNFKKKTIYAFYEPKELALDQYHNLKKEILNHYIDHLDSLKDKSGSQKIAIKATAIAQLLPSCLNEIYKNQLTLETDLIALSKNNVAVILKALREKKQSFNINLVEAIINSPETLDAHKKQACLLLLNNEGKFYPQIKSYDIHTIINEVAVNYFNKQNQDKIISESIELLTLLPSLEPLFSGALEISNTTDNQLKNYLEKIETLKNSLNPDNYIATKLEEFTKKINDVIQNRLESSAQINQDLPLETPSMPQVEIPQTPQNFEASEIIPTPELPETTTAPAAIEHATTELPEYKMPLSEGVSPDESFSLVNLDGLDSSIKLPQAPDVIEELKAPQIPTQQEFNETLAKALIDDYKKTALELIAKDYSSASLEKLQKDFNDIYTVRNSGYAKNLEYELDTAKDNLSQQLLNQTKLFLEQTALNPDTLIPFDHFQKLSLAITNLDPKKLDRDSDKEILKLYSDKLSYDISILIDQIKNKRGEFESINESSQIEDMVKEYLDDQSPTLNPFLAQVLSEIKDLKTDNPERNEAKVFAIEKEVASEPQPESIAQEPISMPTTITPATQVPFSSGTKAQESSIQQKPDRELIPVPAKIEIPQIVVQEQSQTTDIPLIPIEKTDRPTNTVVSPANMSQEGLIRKINTLIIDHAAPLDQAALDSINPYIDQIIKNEPKILRQTINPNHFIHLAEVINLLQMASQASDDLIKTIINEKISKLKERIQTDTNTFIDHIKNRKGKFAEASPEAISFIIDQSKYFNSAHADKGGILHDAKEQVLLTINELKAQGLSKTATPALPAKNPALLITPEQKNVRENPVPEAPVKPIAKVETAPAPVIQTPATPAPAPAAVPQAPTAPESQPNWFSRTASSLWNRAKSWLNNVWAYLTYVS